jgi:integrase
MKAPEAKDRTWLKPDEVVHLVEAAAADKDPRVLPLVLVSLEGAMRPCESSGLDVADFAPAKGTVSIAKSHTNGHIGATKTVGSRRVVHLTPRTVEVVRAYLEARTDSDSKASTIMFPTTRGTRMTPATISDLLRRTATAAKLDTDVTGYTLRRTTVDLMRRSSNDGGTIARLIAGHATVEMTEHYSKGQHDERVALVERALYAAKAEARHAPTAANPGEA